MNKKNRFKMGLIFGLMMFVFYVAQNLLAADAVTTKVIFKSLASSLMAAAIGGVLFGWLMGVFANSKLMEKATQIRLKDGETVLHSTPANHIKGIEAVGGKLYLTNQRLVFKSHKVTFQRHELSIDLNDIAYILPYKALGLLSNGLAVMTKQNKKERFVAEHQTVDGWLSHFQNSHIHLQTV